MRLLRQLPLMAKLLVLALLPILFSAYLTLQIFQEKENNIAQIRDYSRRIEQAVTISRLIDQLHIEREYSFDYALRRISETEMRRSRQVTDSLFTELGEYHDPVLKDYKSYVFVEDPDSARRKIDDQKYAPNQVMHFFSSAAFRLGTLRSLPIFHNKIFREVNNDVITQKLLSEIITYQGIINGNIYNILFTRKYVLETLLGTLPSFNIYRSYHKEFLLKADSANIRAYYKVMNVPEVKQVGAYLDQVFGTFKIDSSLNYDQWKVISHNSIQQWRGFQMGIIKNAENKVNSYLEKEKKAETTYLVLMILFSIILLFIVTYILFSTNKTLQHLRKAALELSEGKQKITINVSSRDAMGALASSISKIDIKNQELARAAERIGEGNFEQPVEIRSKDDHLGNAIVKMQEKLLNYTNDLKRSEQEFVTLADAIPQIIWVADKSGKGIYFNKNWVELTGSLKVNSDRVLSSVIHPDDVGQMMRKWYAALETGTVYETEYRFKEIKSNTYRWYLARAIPMKNEEGEILKWFGTATEIHDQKTKNESLEELVSKRTLELSRSNQDLQQFAHVASHDLKEPLRKIRTFSDRLSIEFGNLIPEKGNIYLEKIQYSASRMSTLIDNILKYSIINSSEQDKEMVDLNSMMEGIHNDLELLIIQKDAKIISDPLPKVKGVPTLIYQVLYNLVNNALKFTRPDTSPLIKISSDLIDASHHQHPGLNHYEKYYRVSVKDNGIGFDEDYMEKMFQVFTRLNSQDKFEGTGLGLALCKKIMYLHDGDIYATGKLGEGSEFHLLFPKT
jgi:PAS domain S-box-containing protein